MMCFRKWLSSRWTDPIDLIAREREKKSRTTLSRSKGIPLKLATPSNEKLKLFFFGCFNFHSRSSAVGRDDFCRSDKWLSKLIACYHHRRGWEAGVAQNEETTTANTKYSENCSCIVSEKKKKWEFHAWFVRSKRSRIVLDRTTEQCVVKWKLMRDHNSCEFSSSAVGNFRAREFDRERDSVAYFFLEGRA